MGQSSRAQVSGRLDTPSSHPGRMASLTISVKYSTSFPSEKPINASLQLDQSNQPLHPLLTTKLHIPPARRDLVPRPRLFDRLTQGLSSKLTLVSAPAGFGKTTLVNAWIATRNAHQPPPAGALVGGRPGGRSEMAVYSSFRGIPGRPLGRMYAVLLAAPVCRGPGVCRGPARVSFFSCRSRWPR
jgi:hypothetical protein